MRSPQYWTIIRRLVVQEYIHKYMPVWTPSRSTSSRSMRGLTLSYVFVAGYVRREPNWVENKSTVSSMYQLISLPIISLTWESSEIDRRFERVRLGKRTKKDILKTAGAIHFSSNHVYTSHRITRAIRRQLRHRSSHRTMRGCWVHMIWRRGHCAPREELIYIWGEAVASIVVSYNLHGRVYNRQARWSRNGGRVGKPLDICFFSVGTDVD